jgi:hypothetical protein
MVRCRGVAASYAFGRQTEFEPLPTPYQRRSNVPSNALPTPFQRAFQRSSSDPEKPSNTSTNGYQRSAHTYPHTPQTRCALYEGAHAFIGMMFRAT